jgi:hypothetical protein
VILGAAADRPWSWSIAEPTGIFGVLRNIFCWFNGLESWLVACKNAFLFDRKRPMDDNIVLDIVPDALMR